MLSFLFGRKKKDDVEEAPVAVASLPEDEDNRIRQLFDKYAKGVKGKLRRDDYRDMLKEVGEISREESQQLFEILDINDNGEIDFNEFIYWWTNPDLDKKKDSSINRLSTQKRNKLSEKYNIFFGFSYGDWRSADKLVLAESSKWTPRQVSLFIATHEDLKVVRSYMTQSDFAQVDGETFFGLDEDDLLNLGVKKMHIKKFQRVIQELASRTQRVHTRRVLMPGPPKSRLPLKSSGLKYRKGDCIGSGSFGSVYIGLEEVSGSMIAIKEIRYSHTDEAHIQQLCKEIELMKTLDHINIVRYLGTQMKSDRLCIITEWVPGGSLSNILDKFGILREDTIAGYSLQILSGLDYLHNNDVVHMDIKCANILVDDRGTIKLADFGAAKRLSLNGMEVSKKLHGTPYYMAPEIVMQKPYDKKADIWSMGCTVLEMSTAMPPWKGEGITDFIKLCKVMTDKKIPKIPDKIHPSLRLFLQQCFIFDPDKRPSACDLLNAEFVNKTWDDVDEFSPMFDDTASTDHRRSTNADIVSYLKINAQDIFGKTRDSLLPEKSRTGKSKNISKIVRSFHTIGEEDKTVINKKESDDNNPFAGDNNVGTDASDILADNPFAGESNLDSNPIDMIDQGSANPFSTHTSSNELKNELTTYEKVLHQSDPDYQLQQQQFIPQPQLLKQIQAQQLQKQNIIQQEVSDSSSSSPVINPIKYQQLNNNNNSDVLPPLKKSPPDSYGNTPKSSNSSQHASISSQCKMLAVVKGARGSIGSQGNPPITEGTVFRFSPSTESRRLPNSESNSNISEPPSVKNQSFSSPILETVPLIIRRRQQLEPMQGGNSPLPLQSQDSSSPNPVDIPVDIKPNSQLPPILNRRMSSGLEPLSPTSATASSSANQSNPRSRRPSRGSGVSQVPLTPTPGLYAIHLTQIDPSPIMSNGNNSSNGNSNVATPMGRGSLRTTQAMDGDSDPYSQVMQYVYVNENGEVLPVEPVSTIPEESSFRTNPPTPSQQQLLQQQQQQQQQQQFQQSQQQQSQQSFFGSNVVRKSPISVRAQTPVCKRLTPLTPCSHSSSSFSNLDKPVVKPRQSINVVTRKALNYVASQAESS